jgi:hypothetical protein
MVDIWALDTLAIALSYFAAMAGTTFLLTEVLSIVRYKTILKALPLMLSSINIKGETNG